MQPADAAGQKLLLTDLGEGIRKITINNPERRNALDYPSLVAFDHLLEDLAQEPVRALIVTGAGEKAFSSGFEIGSIGKAGSLPSKSPDTVVADFMRRLEEFPAPTIAALNGHVFGAGGELAARCDFRVSNGTGQYGMPPAKLGLCYHQDGIRKFVELLGPAAAKELFFTAESVSMQRAEELGLVTHLVTEGFEEFVLDLARKIARSAPLAVRNMKRTFYLLATDPPLSEAALDELQKLRRECLLSGDLLEGQAAFLQKRAPKFRGK